MLVGLSNNGKRYYGAMKHGSMEIVIQRPMLHGQLVKSRSPLILSNVINVKKNGCLRAVFMVIKRDLACFGRKIGILSKRRPIEQRLYLLLTVGYVFVQRRASTWFLCKILRLLTPLKAPLTTFAREELTVSTGPHIRPI
jgi:hypothetical protein